ncbi:nucleotidyltransferase [Thermococcus profundus]|uniref:protein adenylyltransferase n=1 Tax=Thermococcus profundus TaxID=49899 RepID=A0A2Z2MAL4_THEPR|nr:nucleotidyltransferase domain-containing protein [Thermococcus profundus]ASJ02479.1 nucleotidyltransferase [Thermococcus profundus]
MIHRIASTEKREKILEYILEKGEFGVEDVSYALGISKGLVSLYLKELLELGLLEKKGRKFFLRSGVELRETKRFLNFWTLRDKILPLREEWMLALGVYGSFARGENRPESDLDVWVLTKENDPLRIMELQEKLETVTGREVDLLVLTKEKLARLKEENPYLYWSIKLSSIVLWGDLDEV